MTWTDFVEHWAPQAGMNNEQFETTAGAVITGAVLLGIGYFIKSANDAAKHPHGPGPKGVPILGNVSDMPPPDGGESRIYASWSKKYGDLIYMTVLGQPIYVINSFKIANELLDKRAMIYSDRPIMTMAQELVGWNRTPVLTSSQDTKYRRYRKLFHSALNKERVKEMAYLQEQSSHQMLELLLNKPDDFVKHIRYCIGAVITKMAYDYDMKPEGDEFVALAEKSADTFSRAATPGAWLVDLFPWMRHIPAWVPGAKFKRIAAEWKTVNDYLHAKPYNEVKRQMAAGTHGDSITARLLTTRDGEPLDDAEEDRIQWLVGAIYSGGADTTVSALTTFVMAMSIFPEAQRKAQEEIDKVIGTDRLPLMRDRDSLPYCEALFKETLRWQPIAPMGVPHRLIQDDTWDKYTLPKGSTLISNIWAMGHKEADAEDFRPERHLEPSHNDTSIVGEHQDGYIDPKEYVFGFGRRICPGKDLADAGVWLACITMVAAFKFGKKPDGKGGFIDIKVKYTPGIISHPEPFECSITPRLRNSAALIRAAVARDRHE